MTNREFAKKSETFQQRCEKANCKPSGRQASRFINRKGIAYNVWQKKARPLQLGMAGYYARPVIREE